MTPLLSILDHLVYAAPDLDATIERLEQTFSVRAAIGGQHPGWGTKNALLSLGPKAYLEIMGPDLSQSEPRQPLPFGLDSLSRPRLVTWVARTDDLQSVIDKAKRQKLDLGELQEKSRKKPDGSILKWTMTDLTKNRKDGIIPYFINWGDSAHPAESSPRGCRLIKLDVFHPDAKRVNELLYHLGIDLQAESGSVALKATIEIPKGQIVLE
jgi:hypothetical protein